MKVEEINNKTNEAVSYLVKALEAGDGRKGKIREIRGNQEQNLMKLLAISSRLSKRVRVRC